MSRGIVSYFWASSFLSQWGCEAQAQTAVSRAYNKRVKNKSFEEGEIVWKAVLPLGTHVAGYGKWSPTWEGPFIINQILGMGAYRLQDRDGEIHTAPINGKWLKKFYPTMWDSQAVQTDPGIETRLH
ncbi:unnamed protein product [Prunus armeniaca]